MDFAILILVAMIGFPMAIYAAIHRSEQNRVNSVAIQAFHALTSGSIDGCDEDACSDGEECTRVVTATIHEVEDCESKGANDDIAIACPY